MDSTLFTTLSAKTMECLDDQLGDLEHDALDVDLAGDVLTLGFADGTEFVINAHSAARQIWLAANRDAWHFDHVSESESWVAAKTGDELLATVARVVSDKLGCPVRIR